MAAGVSLRMACRAITGRSRVLVPAASARSGDAIIRRLLRARRRDRAVPVRRRRRDARSRRTGAACGEDVACAYFETPTYLGAIETATREAIAALPRGRRAGRRRRRPDLARRARVAAALRRRHRLRRAPAARRPHALRRRPRRLRRHAGRRALRARVPDVPDRPHRPRRARRDGFGEVARERTSYMRRERGKDFGGTTHGAVGDRGGRLPLDAGRRGHARAGRGHPPARGLRGRSGSPRSTACRSARRTSRASRSSRCPSRARARRSSTSTGTCCERGHPRRARPRRSRSWAEALYCVTEVHTPGRHRPPRRGRRGGGARHERRAAVPPGSLERADRVRAGIARRARLPAAARRGERSRPWPDLPPRSCRTALRRRQPPALPEIAQPRPAQALPAPLAGDDGRGHRRRHRPGHGDDEVQPAVNGSSIRIARQLRRPAPAGGPVETRAGSARDRRALRGHPVRALGHRPLQLPARRRHARHLRERVHRARLPRPPRGERSATRSSRPSSRTRATPPAPATAGYRIVTLYAGPERLPDARRPAAALSRAHGRAHDHQSRGHRALQPADRRARRRSCTRPAACAPTTRPTRTACSASPAPRDAGFDMCQFNLHKTFGSPHGSVGLPCGAIGVSRRAGALPAGADGRARGDALLPRPRSARSRRPRARVLRRVGTVVRAYAWVHQPRRRGAAAGGRDRRAEQQLPRDAAAGVPGHRGRLR